MTQMIVSNPEASPSTPVDIAFSYGMEMWHRINLGEFSGQDPASTYKEVEAGVKKRLGEFASWDEVKSIVDGTRFVARSDARVETLNNFLFEIAADPSVSLSELRESYSTQLPKGDETVYSIARILTKDQISLPN